LLYLLHVVEEASRDTTATIHAIRALLQRTSALVRDHAPKIYSREFVDVIFERPYCRIADIVRAGIAKRQTASEYLMKLTEMRVLEVVQAGREKLFLHRALLALLASEPEPKIT
jgi:Fic family protein